MNFKNKAISSLMVVGLATGIGLPEYSLKHLKWINPPTRAGVIGLCYDTDGDNIEDLRELRRYNFMTRRMDKPFKFYYDKNRDGIYTDDEAYMPASPPVQKEKE